MDPSVINGRYRIEAELGRGGLGIIYRGHDLLLDRDVAVKVLSNPSLKGESRARLLREARIAAQLNHPNIVSIYDAGETQPEGGPGESTVFIIMELIEGHSLLHIHLNSLEAVVAILRQVCLALEAAHARGIIHRDLKPENIIVTPSGVAKLTDFGLARSVASRLSQDGLLVGTIYYLAPEMALNQPVDARTDLYALGVLMFELATGRLPFTEGDPLAVIAQHIHAPVVPPSTYNSAIPPALDTLIVRLLAKSPDDRPSSAAEVRGVLDALGSPQADLPLEIAAPSPLDRLALGRLVAREHELAEAREQWHRVIFQTGQENILLIEGEEGVGKTPLVQALQALAEYSGGRCLKSQCYAEGSAPYALVAELVSAALSDPVPDVPEPVLADLAYLSPSLAALYPHLARTTTEIPMAEQHRLFESVYSLFSRLAARAPLLLVVEDVHWADGGTLALLRHLARRSRAARLPLMILLTLRENEATQACCLPSFLFELRRDRAVLEIRIAPFDREQTHKVIAAILQQEITEQLLDRVYRLTEGNLFYIEETVKLLVDEGKLVCDDGGWRISDLEDLHLPETVRMAILVRISGQSPETHEVLRLAATFGREFSFEELQAAAGSIPEDQLMEALESAEAAQIVREVKQGNGKIAGKIVYTFEHGLIPTTLLESLSSLRRRKLHRRVALALEALRPENYETLAYHNRQAGDEVQARKYLRLAGQRALAAYANEQAEHELREALALNPTGAERGALLGDLGEAQFCLSHFKEAYKNWLDAVQVYKELGDLDKAAWYYARAGRSVWYTSHPSHGLSVCKDGLADIGALTADRPEQLETPGMAALLHETARAYRFNNLPEEALPLCWQALDLAGRLGLLDVQADVYATLGVLQHLPPEESREYLSRAVEISELAGLLLQAIRAHENLGELQQVMGQLNEAISNHVRAREISRKMGNRDWEYHQVYIIARLQLKMGRFSDAARTLAEMEAIEPELVYPEMECMQRRSLQAELHRYLGELDRAAAEMQACLVNACAAQDEYLIANLLQQLAGTLLQLDRLEEAAGVAGEAVRFSEQTRGINYVSSRYEMQAVRIRQGWIEEARELLEQARSNLGRVLVTTDQAWLLWMEARQAAVEGRLPDALRFYESVTDRAGEIGVRWFQAHLLREWAGVVQDAGQSRELMRRSSELFKELG